MNSRIKAVLVNSSLVAALALTVFNLPGMSKAQEIDVDSMLMGQAQSENVNIMLYDYEGKIQNEYHADGLVVTYGYEDGKINKSKDNRHLNKEIVYEESDGAIVEHIYENGKLTKARKLAGNNKPNLSAEERKQKIDRKLELQKQNIAFDNSIAAYEDYYVNGVRMNDIAKSPPTDGSYFIMYASMSESDIQDFLEEKGSILQYDIEIWRKNSSGTVYNTGVSVTPSELLWDAQNDSSHPVNVKVLLAMLQKESSIVTDSSVSESSRRLYYAMGYGATDGGDLAGTSGFDIQIDKGSELLFDLYADAPDAMPARMDNINYGDTVTSGGVTYKNYIWIDNYGTWALFRYTPHALDIELLPSIGGGNYLFHDVFDGWWGDDWGI